MWGWGAGGLLTLGLVGWVGAGGGTCHCGPCVGRADDQIVTPPPAAVARVVVRFDEPPLARRPETPRYSSPADPF